MIDTCDIQTFFGFLKYSNMMNAKNFNVLFLKCYFKFKFVLFCCNGAGVLEVAAGKFIVMLIVTYM